MIHLFKHLLGLDGPDGIGYLFWSGFGGYLVAFAGGIRWYVGQKRQREHHHQQLKDHIDYKFRKLTDREGE